MAIAYYCTVVQLWALYQLTFSQEQKVDLRYTFIYGPGTNPTVVFPARYFFIQAVDSQGNNFTTSAGNVFSATVESATEFCRVWTQVLDREDGTYIVRYRLFNTCSDISIAVKYRGNHVGQSPYKFKSVVYNEECYCPQPMESWLEEMQCPYNYDQIDSDLEVFSKGVNGDESLKQAVDRFNIAGAHSLCNYVILNNEIYRKCYGQHIGFNMFMDNILLSLARKLTLPDLDFIVNLGDWPLVNKDDKHTPLPIFSWCGSENSHDIVMPTYGLTEATLECMGRVMLDMLSVQGKPGPSWDNKISKGFWRGRDSRQERLDLVGLSRQYPELVNASLTNFFFFKDKENEYGPKVKHMSFFDFFQFKYQISLDGTVAAYRMPYLLAGTSVVLKQESPYYEHFYRQLQPNVHFIEFKRDLSNLVDKLQWAKDNDQQIQEIAENGRVFARDNLMPKDIFCYHAVLLQKFAELLKSSVKVRPGMDKVAQASDQYTCRCLRHRGHDEL